MELKSTINNDNYNDNCQTCDTVKLLSKSVIGLQKINEINKKHFGSRRASLKSLESICF